MNFEPTSDLWKYLSATDKKIVMYGMGNGADKILSVCERYGIPVSDFFASDGFVRGHSFHGKTVLSYTQIKEKYGAENIIVLLSFASSRPEVLDLFDKVDRECELYAPDVPVCGDSLFNLEFFRENREKIHLVYGMLEDEESRKIYENVIRYKLSGKISYLRDAVSDRDAVWAMLGDIEIAADLGAYNGDTAKELIAYRGGIKEIIALEPDRRNFRKLSEYAAEVVSPRIRAVNAAAWNASETLTFSDSGNRNAGAFASGKKTYVPAVTLDSLLDGGRVDYIKYDVEGAEKEALEGSRISIVENRPSLLVSVYHRSEDIFALPLQVKELCPDYKLFLRRYPYVPAWDLNLICL